MNAILGFVENFSPLTRVLYPSGVLLDTNFYNLVIEEKDETDLHFASRTMLILSEEISNSMVQEAPFHEEDSKVGQKAHQKSLVQRGLAPFLLPGEYHFVLGFYYIVSL